MRFEHYFLGSLILRAIYGSNFIKTIKAVDNKIKTYVFEFIFAKKGLIFKIKRFWFFLCFYIGLFDLYNIPIKVNIYGVDFSNGSLLFSLRCLKTRAL